MSDRVIKNYKYVTKDYSPKQRREQVIKNEMFPDALLPVFDGLSSGAATKKRQLLSRLHNKCHSDSGLAKTSAVSINTIIKQSHTSTPESQKDQINQDFESRLAQETQQTYHRGFQEGHAKGTAEWTPQARNIANSFQKATAQLDSQFRHYCEETEKNIIDLAIHLAEKIVGEAAHKMSDVAKTNLSKCTNLLAGSGNVAVKINPSDYDTIKAFLPTVSQKYEGKFTFLIEPDQNVTSGGCVVELDGSMIDARIETQLTNIRNHMQILS